MITWAKYKSNPKNHSSCC